MNIRGDFTARISDGSAGLTVLILPETYLTYILTRVVLGCMFRDWLNSVATLAFYIGVFVMLSLTLNLHWGYIGLLNTGIVGSMAVGVYITAIVMKPTHVAGDIVQVSDLGLLLWMSILADITAAALSGLAVALPASRLRANYLAIVIIAIPGIVRFSFLSGELQQFQLFGNRVGFGGGSGFILDFSPPLEAPLRGVGLWNEYLGFVGTFQVLVPRDPKPVVDDLIYGLLLSGFTVDFYWLLKHTSGSPFGCVLKAIRKDEDIASALNKNTDRFRTKPFILGCALIGFADILWLAPQDAMTPNFFRPRVTFFIWIAFITGGAGSNIGGVFGGAVFTAVFYQGSRYFQNLVSAVFPNFGSPPDFEQVVSPLVSQSGPVPFLLYMAGSIRQPRLIVMGLVLIQLMRNRSEGMFDYRRGIASVIPLSRLKSTVADGGVDAVVEGGEAGE